jgi:hypothetical protein
MSDELLRGDFPTNRMKMFAVIWTAFLTYCAWNVIQNAAAVAIAMLTPSNLN